MKLLILIITLVCSVGCHQATTSQYYIPDDATPELLWLMEQAYRSGSYTQPEDIPATIRMFDGPIVMF